MIVKGDKKKGSRTNRWKTVRKKVILLMLLRPMFLHFYLENCEKTVGKSIEIGPGLLQVGIRIEVPHRKLSTEHLRAQEGEDAQE